MKIKEAHRQHDVFTSNIKNPIFIISIRLNCDFRMIFMINMIESQKPH